MEPEELRMIRESANPWEELIFCLEHEGFGAAEAVQSGLLSHRQIHQYVLFCMQEMADEVARIMRKSHVAGSFTSFVVGETIKCKERWIARECKQDSILTDSIAGLSSLNGALSKARYDDDSAAISDLVDDILGCMSTDAYEAHAHASPVFATKSDGIKTDAPSLERRRDWMLDFLKWHDADDGGKEKVRGATPSAPPLPLVVIVDPVRMADPAKTPSTRKGGADSQGKKDRGKKEGKKGGEKGGGLQQIIESRKRKSEW